MDPKDHLSLGRNSLQKGWLDLLPTQGGGGVPECVQGMAECGL